MFFFQEEEKAGIIGKLMPVAQSWEPNGACSCEEWLIET
jgi:hypothetical protein